MIYRLSLEWTIPLVLVITNKTNNTIKVPITIDALPEGLLWILGQVISPRVRQKEFQLTKEEITYLYERRISND